MNNWTIIKTILLIVICLLSFFYLPEQIGEQPPLFIYPIITLASFIFALAFFKGASTHKKLTIGAIQSPLKDIFHDPLPFHHLSAIALFCSGIIGVVKYQFSGLAINPISLFELAIGIGSYLSVLIANKYFIKEPKKLKKV